MTTPELIEAARASGRIDRDTALLYLSYALGDYERLPEEYRSDIPWHGTMPLLQLQESVSVVQSAATRSAIRSVLRGACASSASLPQTRDTTHFHVEYDTIGGGLTIDDYATSLDAAWETQVTAFGWAAPPVLSSNPPPGDRYHVRIEALGGLYGYVNDSGDHAGFVGDNPNTGWNEGDAYASCMVLNRDYALFPGTPQQALDATTAHEFNHSIQFGYGAVTGANSPDIALIEGGATWMEDEVFDSSNDNHGFLWPIFGASMGQYPYSPYSYWITLRGLTERHGTGIAGGGEDVMQDFWEETSKSASSNMFSALNTALINKGTTLADAYHAYAVAVKFNRACGGGYVYPYCLEEGPAYVSAAGATSVHGTIAAVGDSYSGGVADNYALNWVSLPTSGGSYDVALENTSAGGQLRGSVACDTGTAIAVSALPTVVGPGSSSTLESFNPTGCTSVVAVVTNQSQTADNPTSSTSRSYTLRTLVDTGTSTPAPTNTPSATPTETATPTATATSTPDTSAPIILAVSVQNIAATSADIVWTTDEPAGSQVDWGLTSSLGTSTPYDPTLVTDHSQTLTGLTPETVYFYRASSTDAFGNGPTTTQVGTFTTSASPTATPSLSPTPSATPTATATGTSTPASTPPATGTPSGLVGDGNCDGAVNSIDAALILQLDAGLVGSLPCQQNADLSGNGNINSIDAAIVLQCDAGLFDCASLAGEGRWALAVRPRSSLRCVLASCGRGGAGGFAAMRWTRLEPRRG